MPRYSIELPVRIEFPVLLSRQQGDYSDAGQSGGVKHLKIVFKACDCKTLGELTAGTLSCRDPLHAEDREALCLSSSIQ